MSRDYRVRQAAAIALRQALHAAHEQHHGQPPWTKRHMPDIAKALAKAPKPNLPTTTQGDNS